MDIAALQAFIAVARFESFSRASESLRLTQPAVSKRVAGLEQELSTQLFNRVARQVSLTEAGKALLPRAQEMVDQAEDMRRYAVNLQHDISGKLSIAIAHHIGLHRMPPILRRYNQQHANVALDIRFEDSDRATEMMERGDIEFAVITLPSQLPASLSKETIWRDPLTVVVAPDHPLASLRRVEPSLLSSFAAVLPSPNTETHLIIKRYLQEQGQNLNVQMETNNLESLKMLVGAGIGWSLLPKTMLDDSIVPLELPQALQRNLGLVIHNKRSLSNAAKALIALMRSS